MNEEATIAVHGARDDPGSCAIAGEPTSLQLTADRCDLNLATRKKGEIRPGKNRGAPRRSGIRLSVGRPDQDTLNNSSPGSSAGSDDRQASLRVCALASSAAPTLFPRHD